MSAFPSWAGIDSPIARLVDDFSRRCLAAYEVNPTLIREHAAIERATRQGGYGGDSCMSWSRTELTLFSTHRGAGSRFS